MQKNAHFNEKKSLHAVPSLKESLSLTPPHCNATLCTFRSEKGWGMKHTEKREKNRKEELYIFYYRNSIITLKIKVPTKK